MEREAHARPEPSASRNLTADEQVLAVLWGAAIFGAGSIPFG